MNRREDLTAEQIRTGSERLKQFLNEYGPKNGIDAEATEQIYRIVSREPAALLMAYNGETEVLEGYIETYAMISKESFPIGSYTIPGEAEEHILTQLDFTEMLGVALDKENKDLELAERFKLIIQLLIQAAEKETEVLTDPRSLSALESLRIIYDYLQQGEDIREPIAEYLEGKKEFMPAPRPAGYEELQKINRTGEESLQTREDKNVKISFNGRFAIEEQKIFGAFGQALIDQNHYGATKGLDTRVFISIEPIMYILGRSNTPDNIKKFKRQLKTQILKTIANTSIEASRKNKDGKTEEWLRTNIGQEYGITRNGKIYFQFTERFAQYLNTGRIPMYHSKTYLLGSRQFPLPFYLAGKIQTHYFYDKNINNNRNAILSIQTILNFSEEIINYDYIMEYDPTHWKREIKDKIERALNEIQEIGLFKWEYCGKSMKEIPQRKIDNATFDEWRKFYICVQFIPEEPDQAQRLEHKQERIEAAKERKALEDDKIRVEADKIRKRKPRKRKTAENAKQTSK